MLEVGCLTQIDKVYVFAAEKRLEARSEGMMQREHSLQDFQTWLL